MADEPAMDPNTSEADETQLRLARAQGDAYLTAVRHMIEEVADTGGLRDVGEYTVGYAIEEAEGMYALTGDGLEWQEPGETTTHVEVAVVGGADGGVVPGVAGTPAGPSPDGAGVSAPGLPPPLRPKIFHHRGE